MATCWPAAAARMSGEKQSESSADGLAPAKDTRSPAGVRWAPHSHPQQLPNGVMHALRFSVDCIRQTKVPPGVATSVASSNSTENYEHEGGLSRAVLKQPRHGCQIATRCCHVQRRNLRPCLSVAMLRH